MKMFISKSNSKAFHWGLSMSDFEKLRAKIVQRKCRVCVVGLGYIGFPTALFYKKSGNEVVGLDLNKGLIEDLRKGNLRIIEDGLDELAISVLPGIEFHSDYSDLDGIDIFVLCLPSPIDEEKTPNISYLESSLSEIAAKAKKPILVIVESTVPVGFTESQAVRFGQISSLKHDEQFWFVHSPERVLPGNVIREMQDNERLIGGVTEKGTELGYLFLASVFGEDKIHKTNSRSSETTKLAENAYRDTCIAFANELALLSTEIGIDVREVIRLANLHPRVDILDPGLGVGGYCVPKDGWILVNSMDSTRKLARIIPAARHVNDSMPNHLFQRLKDKLGPQYLAIARFGVLGLAYKPNVNDTRMSPAIDLVNLLKKDGRELMVYDPYMKNNSNVKMSQNIDEIVDSCEVIILAVNHAGLSDSLLRFDLSDKVIVDPTGTLLGSRSKFSKYIGLTV